jgi:hypothetical protein
MKPPRNVFQLPVGRRHPAAGGSGVHVLCLDREAHRPANELRYASRNLVEELRQSSDDLTRMARTYVATGEPSTATTTRKSSTSATAARPPQQL